MKEKLFFICFFLIPVLLFSQQVPKAKKISGDLYEVALDGCNSAFLVTDSGVIVVDAGISPLDGWLLKRSIAEVTKKMVKYIIITHHHFDHIGGVQVFMPGAQVIAQAGFFPNVEKCGMSLLNGFVEEMEADYKSKYEKKSKLAEEYISKGMKDKSDSIWNQITYYRAFIDSVRAVKPVSPSITFKNRYRMMLGGQQVFLSFPGKAHTGSDCIVYFPAQKVIHVGDLYFEKAFPFIDSCSGANLSNWMNVLENLSHEKNFTHFLCGHGSISSSVDFLIMKQMFIDMREEVKASVSKGLTLDQTLLEVKMNKYKDYQNWDLLEKNIRVLYFELKK